jgi:hypothetical protein
MVIVELNKDTKNRCQGFEFSDLLGEHSWSKFLVQNPTRGLDSVEKFSYVYQYDYDKFGHPQCEYFHLVILS